MSISIELYELIEGIEELCLEIQTNGLDETLLDNLKEMVENLGSFLEE